MIQDPNRSNRLHFDTIVGVCPVCHESAQYDPDAVVQQEDGMLVAYGNCPSCAISLFTIEVGKNGSITSIGIITDLQKNEVQTFWKNASITEDMVIEIHTAIQQSSTIHQHNKTK